MATHSSILAGRISRTEKPGGLQSTGVAESDTTEQLTTSTPSAELGSQPRKSVFGVHPSGHDP